MNLVNFIKERLFNNINSNIYSIRDKNNLIIIPKSLVTKVYKNKV